MNSSTNRLKVLFSLFGGKTTLVPFTLNKDIVDVFSFFEAVRSEYSGHKLVN